MYNILMLNKKGVINMKKLNENNRRNMIECFINNKIILVHNYVAAKELPKYIANAMIIQLELALEQSLNGFYQDSYASLLAYTKLYSNYAKGHYTINEPRINKWYHSELSISNVYTELLALSMPIHGGLLDHYVSVRKTGMKFEITKSVA